MLCGTQAGGGVVDRTSRAAETAVGGLIPELVGGTAHAGLGGWIPVSLSARNTVDSVPVGGGCWAFACEGEGVGELASVAGQHALLLECIISVALFTRQAHLQAVLPEGVLWAADTLLD